MSDAVEVAIRKSQAFDEFLTLNGFGVEDFGGGNFAVTREGELPVMVNVTEGVIRFQVDLCPTSAIDSKDTYFKLLDLNTEVVPVSFGIDSTDSDNPRLVITESRLVSDLNDEELLGVFDTLELATDRAEELLTDVLAS
jgi:uncharacterized protein YjfI (DUF2170 family)